MPYTPPTHRSPASSNASSPNLSRRSSFQPGQTLGAPSSNKPELPRSASYLTRHRRTSSVKTASFAPTSEPTPPGTADREDNDINALNAHGSLRQSPPPVTSEAQVPAGVVLSPPESTQNSSDDEDGGKDSKRLENLKELEAALVVINQHRESSPNRQAADLAKANQALTLVMPAELDRKSTIQHIEESIHEAHKISHHRSNTDSSVFIDLHHNSNSASPASGSEEEDSEDDDERSRRGKPPMLRKKSGELVRPALRPSSSRRRPSSMPGTPTFSKAVHFDSHLEHVRHFLQVDRPLAVSAGSSPVESYESDNEFPFSEDDNGNGHRGPPFDWEIVVSNFPTESPDRLRLPVRVERVFLSTDNKTLIGSVAVANLAFNKMVIARFTLDYWKTTSEVVAEYSNDVRRKQQPDGFDRFNFNIKLADQANLEAKTMFFCVKYIVNGTEYWDNNNNTNFQVDFRKKYKPQNGKKGSPGAASRTVNGLPRSSRKSPPTTNSKAHVMPAAFDDFADGFDATTKYDYAKFSRPVNDYLGSNGPVRLKGVKSAVSIASDNLTRKAPNPNGQAFSNRYDFGASLSAAINAANSAMGDRSGLTMKSQAKAPAPKTSAVKPVQESAPAASLATPTEANKSTDPLKPTLASQSYNELLDKYCFFGSVKSSPQLKDGTLGTRSAQYDGNDDGYILRSESPSPDQGSPLQIQMARNPTPRTESNTSKPEAARSASPAPMTGFVTGTSPAYLNNMRGSFPFNEAYTATAIRG
jgi:hypothetical protein